MPGLSRRRFLAATAAAAGAAVVGSGTAAAATEGRRRKPKRHRDLRDIKHIVVVMQENRSFDHYFGTLQGVRGFGDRSTITLPGGYYALPGAYDITVIGPNRFLRHFTGNALLGDATSQGVR